MLSARDFKTNSWLLISAICISIAFRYPFQYHEAGIDSFYIHNLANSISISHTIPWALSPLSYFGLYALSYPAGAPIILSEFSTMTGLTIEMTMLIFSFIVAIISVISSYLFAYEINRSPLFLFGFSIVYSCTPFFLLWTQWSFPSRALILALLPLVLAMLFRFEKISSTEYMRRNKISLYAILFSILVLLLMTHRIVFLIGIFMVAFLIARYLRTMKLRKFNMKKILIAGTDGIRSAATKGFIFSISVVGIILLLWFATTMRWVNLDTYEKGFFPGDSDVNKIVNLMVSIAVTVGVPIVIFFPLGFYLGIKKSKKEFYTIFLLISLIMILPLSGGRIYERFLYPPILLVFIFSPIFELRKKRLKIIISKLMIISIILTFILNLVVVNHWNTSPQSSVTNDTNLIETETYMTSLYMSYYYTNNNFIGNNWLINQRTQSYSSCPELPNALSPTHGINILIYGIVDPNNLEIKFLSLSEIIENNKFYDSEKKYMAEYDWIYLFLYPGGLPGRLTYEETLLKYNTKIFIEDKEIMKKITGWESLQLYPIEGHAPFISLIHVNDYKIYENGREIIWQII